MRHHRPSLILSSFFLLLSTVTLVLTATLPTVQAPPLTNVTELTAAGSTLNCFNTYPFSPFFLTQHKCAEAIHDLSDAVRPGRFHYGEPLDSWSLPIVRPKGHCKVAITMSKDGTTESASWVQIKLAATALNAACASKYRTRYAGGWVSVGDSNEIIVTIDYNTDRATANS